MNNSLTDSFITRRRRPRLPYGMEGTSGDNEAFFLGHFGDILLRRRRKTSTIGIVSAVFLMVVACVGFGIAQAWTKPTGRGNPEAAIPSARNIAGR